MERPKVQIPCDMLIPDNETFRINTLSTYNVIEAACKLGIKKIIIASSETVYSVCFTQGESDYLHFPIEEDGYDCNPEDSYACSKLCGERVARSFARRFGVDIYALRIGNVRCSVPGNLLVYVPPDNALGCKGKRRAGYGLRGRL